MNLGAIHLGRRDYAAAETAFERALARGTPEAEHALGLLYQLRGDYKAAYKAFRRAEKAGVKAARDAQVGLARELLDRRRRRGKGDTAS